MITARTFFFRSVLAGLVIGALLSQFNPFRANLWLENLTSPVSYWFRSKDCATLASTLASTCAAAHARAVPPELVAAANAIEREQEAMRAVWLSVKFPAPSHVTVYLRIEPPSRPRDIRLAHAEESIFLPLQPAQDEGATLPALRMTGMVPIAAPSASPRD